MSYIANPGTINVQSSGSATIYQGTDVSLVPYISGTQNLGSAAIPYNVLYANNIAAGSIVSTGTLGNITTGNIIVASGSYVQFTSSGNNAWKVGVHDDGTLYTF